MEWLDAIQKMATGGAAVTAAVVAALGLRAWHVQLRGKTEYDLARRLLRLVFEVRDQIAGVRHPFMSAGEIAAAFKDGGIDPADVKIPDDRRADRLVYDRRWRSLTRALSDLGVEAVEAEVHWGSKVRDLQLELHRCVGELNAALIIYLREERYVHGDREKAIATHERVSALVFAGYTGPDDPFAARVAAAVVAFESLLRPKLRFRV